MSQDSDSRQENISSSPPSWENRMGRNVEQLRYSHDQIGCLSFGTRPSVNLKTACNRTS